MTFPGASDIPYEFTLDDQLLDLRVTQTVRTDETSELHWSEKGSTVALCGVSGQGRATQADQNVYLRPWCFTCTEDKRLSEES